MASCMAVSVAWHVVQYMLPKFPFDGLTVMAMNT